VVVVLDTRRQMQEAEVAGSGVVPVVEVVEAETDLHPEQEVTAEMEQEF